MAKNSAAAKKSLEELKGNYVATIGKNFLEKRNNPSADLNWASESLNYNYLDICKAEDDYFERLTNYNQKGWLWALLNKKNSTEEDHAAKIILTKLKRNTKKNLALAAALFYGALQGGGMAGFIFFLFGEAKLFSRDHLFEMNTDADIDRDVLLLAIIAFITVTTYNTLLVREDITKKFLFKKETEKTEASVNRAAIFLCFCATFTYGLITAYGLQNTINTFEYGPDAGGIGDRPSDYIGISAFTMIVFLAEFCLMIDPIKQMLSKPKDLVPTFDTYVNSKKAKGVYIFSVVASTIGIMGTALVCSETLSNLMGDENEDWGKFLSLTILSTLALFQLPLYMDRANQFIANNFRKHGAEEVNSFKQYFTQTDDNSIKGASFYSYRAFLPLHALFNAPVAYLGVVHTLASFSGLTKTETSALESLDINDALFAYGSSTEANIIYSIGLMFFIGAFSASFMVNSKPPTKVISFKDEPAKDDSKQKNESWFSLCK